MRKLKYDSKYCKNLLITVGYIYADESLLSEGKTQIRNDIVLSFSQITGRKFIPRKEVGISIELQNAIETKNIQDHDAFGAVGDD